MNVVGGVGALVMALTWVWFLVFPLAVVAYGVGQVVRDTGRALSGAAAGLPDLAEELRQVVCPSTGENLEVAVLRVAPSVFRVKQCPRFSDGGPVTCAQGCLAQG